MEWINVKDRLPELRRVNEDYCESDYVLVFAPDYDPPIFTATYEVDDCGLKIFNTFSDITRSEISVSEVTHWMPLPLEPPFDD